MQAGIKTLTKEGYRVIRLDRRKVPDAIAVKDSDVIAVEADTSPTSIWLTRKAFDKGVSQYDAEIIVTKPYSEHFHARAEYMLALELRKQGMSFRAMKRLLEEKFPRRFSTSILHDWCSGRKKPPGI